MADCIEKIKKAVADPIVYDKNGEVRMQRHAAMPRLTLPVTPVSGHQGWNNWGAVRSAPRIA